MFLRILKLLVSLIRLIAGTLLLVIEPPVRLVLCSLSVVGCAMTAFFALTQSAPPSVIAGMLLVSIAALILLRGYYALVQRLR